MKTKLEINIERLKKFKFDFYMYTQNFNTFYSDRIRDSIFLFLFRRTYIRHQIKYYSYNFNNLHKRFDLYFENILEELLPVLKLCAEQKTTIDKLAAENELLRRQLAKEDIVPVSNSRRVVLRPRTESK